MMIGDRADIRINKWGPPETTFVVWVGIALAILIPSTLYLHAASPIFTVLWLVVPLWVVVRRADAHQVGFNSISWSKFFSTTVVNLCLLLLVSVLVEPWSHAYQALVKAAISGTTPDSTFAWIAQFTGLKAWGGLILYSGLVTMFAEELFFRGWLLQSLQRKMRKSWAIAIQAALFTLPQLLAALILSPLQGVVYIIFYSFLAIGVIGGWAAVRTQSIWPSLVSATVWNAIMVALV